MPISPQDAIVIKAALEVIKPVCDLAKPAVELGLNLVGSLLGESFKVAGGLAGDWVYGFQTLNRIRWAVRVDEELKRTGVSPKVLPKGFLLPVMETVGNIENEDLRAYWARLTAKAIMDDDAQSPAFLEALKRLSPKDGQCFERFGQYGHVLNYAYVEREGLRASVSRLLSIGLLDESISAELPNKRQIFLGPKLLEVQDSVFTSGFKRRETVKIDKPGVVITRFGRDLYTLITPPPPDAPKPPDF